MSVKGKTIVVQGAAVAVSKVGDEDYISLTDMARHKEDQEIDAVIFNWMSTHYTIDFLAVWEQVNNPDFKPMGFQGFKNSKSRLLVSPKRWVEATNAIGIFSRSGRYGGGTFAHRDIAFEFGTWLSAEFKYYLILEFQRLKESEQRQASVEWDLQRTLAKINYRIHTDAIKAHIIPLEVTKEQARFTYASEADLLNVALFGVTATQWRVANPDAGKKVNIRDEASLEQLIVLSNLESINALLIEQGLSQGERLVQLNRTAITQMKSLVDNSHIRRLAEDQDHRNAVEQLVALGGSDPLVEAAPRSRR